MKILFILIFTLALFGCDTSPRKSSGVSTFAGKCPPGQMKEIDSNECEDILDALDLDEDWDYDKRKKAVKPPSPKKKQVKPKTKTATKAVPKPKRVVKPKKPAYKPRDTYRAKPRFGSAKRSKRK